MIALSATVLFIYLAVLIYIGFRHFKSNKTMENYWMADRSLPGFNIGFMICAAWFGLSSFTGQAGWFYSEGLGALFYLAIPNLAAIGIVGLVFLKRIRKIPAISQPEMLEMRFHSSLRPWLGIIILLSFTGYSAMEYIAMGYVFENFLHWPAVVGGIVIAACTIIYLCLGGMRTMVWTEVMQYIMLATIGVALAIFFMTGASAVAPAGTSLFSVPQLEGANFWSFASIGWFMVFVMILAYWPGWSTEQDSWQKIWMAKDNRNAYKGVYYALGALVLVYTLDIFIGTAAWTLIGPPSEGVNPEEIIYIMMNKTMPWWLIALATAGFMAAAMSNISNFSVSAASNITKDWYQRYFRPHATQREMLMVSRIIVSICVVLGIFVAMAVPSILDALFVSATIGSTGYFVPIVGAMYWRRANNTGAMASLIIGGGSDVLFYSMKLFGGYEFAVEPVLYALVISIAAFIIGSLLTPAPPTEKLLTFFEKDTEKYIANWKALGISSTPTEDALKYVKGNMSMDVKGDRLLAVLNVKLEGVRFAALENWVGFINTLLANKSWVWLSGYDVVY